MSTTAARQKAGFSVMSLCNIASTPCGGEERRMGRAARSEAEVCYRHVEASNAATPV